MILIPWKNLKGSSSSFRCTSSSNTTQSVSSRSLESQTIFEIILLGRPSGREESRALTPTSCSFCARAKYFSKFGIYSKPEAVLPIACGIASLLVSRMSSLLAQVLIIESYESRESSVSSWPYRHRKNLEVPAPTPVINAEWHISYPLSSMLSRVATRWRVVPFDWEGCQKHALPRLRLIPYRYNCCYSLTAQNQSIEIYRSKFFSIHIRQIENNAGLANLLSRNVSYPASTTTDWMPWANSDEWWWLTNALFRTLVAAAHYPPDPVEHVLMQQRSQHTIIVTNHKVDIRLLQKLSKIQLVFFYDGGWQRHIWRAPACPTSRPSMCLCHQFHPMRQRRSLCFLAAAKQFIPRPAGWILHQQYLGYTGYAIWTLQSFMRPSWVLGTIRLGLFLVELFLMAVTLSSGNCTTTIRDKGYSKRHHGLVSGRG